MIYQKTNWIEGINIFIKGRGKVFACAIIDADIYGIRAVIQLI